MVAYCNVVRKLENKFDGLELNHVARRFNEVADELAKAVSGRKPVPDGIFVSDQFKPSIHYQEPRRVGDAPLAPDSSPNPGEVGNAPPIPSSSADPDEVGDAPPALDSEADPSDPEVMEIDADPELYKRSDTNILPRCIPIEQGKALIQDIHAGSCGHHATPRTLVGNAFRQDFYWPMAVADATHVVRTCEGCQFFTRQTLLPTQAFQTIPITWPFMGLKPRIFDCLKRFSGRWVAELPAVLWSLRTTPCRATGFAPFFMVYGSKAILPTNLEYGSPRVKAYDEQGN
ncbi:uncharacterized protein [Setaria viridis]|uniref:uncharacterized protein n=1 Tax=Setaria viridis TaxID=4556 RepID=UPI00149344A8|nr:uncharacterized protein LOC117834419 [Setaria viridis]